MTEAEAADSRLRSWLRRAGRPANYGKKYGSLPEEEDDIAVGSIAPEEAGRVGGVMKMARKCRKIICTVFGAVVCLAGITLLAYVYIAVSPDDLAFVTIGDWGCGPENCLVPPQAPAGYHHGAQNTKNVAQSMAQTAKNIGSKFVLALGDNFYFRGVESASDPLWKSVWEKQFDYASLHTPWYAILGNHDHYGNPEAQIDFSRKHLDCKEFEHCPARWVMPRYWYSVVHPSARKRFDVQFVFIDTVILAEASSKAMAEEKARLGMLNKADMARWEAWSKEQEMMGRLQLEWLEQTLNASTADWLIVAGHYPVYSGGEHGDTPELQHRVKPLLEKYNVDAYLCGHDHTLQMLESNGVHYFVSGSGSFHGQYSPKGESLFGTVECGFMAHRIMPSRMDVSIIDQHGKTLYRSFIPRKRNRNRGGVGELAGVEKEFQMDADKVYKIF